MKIRSIPSLTAAFFLCLMLVGSTWAGQVKTDDVKEWVQKTLKQEKMLSTAEIPVNSVAVLYYRNMTGEQKLNPIQKGLSLMLMTDLSKLKEIQLLERIKVHSLMEELGLSASGLLEAESSTRLGKIIGAKYLIGGEIDKEKPGRFQFTSNLLNSNTKTVYNQTKVSGELITELIRMEKDLLFHIIRDLKFEITVEQENYLKKPLSNNPEALMLLFQAIDFSDNSDYQKAYEYYEKALEADPSLEMAQTCMAELEELGLAGKRRAALENSYEAYSESQIDELKNRAPELLKRPFDGKSDNDRQDLTEGEIAVNLNLTFNNPSGNTLDRQPSAIDASTLQANPTGDDSRYTPGDLLNDGTWTEGYAYGLQAVGQNQGPEVLVDTQTLADIQDNSLIAYQVQAEEDLLNQKALDLHRQLVTDQAALDAINDALDHADLRERDAWLVQNADAQAGRVLRDREGRWARTQQYILRPDGNTVQLLNVTYRGENELSTMNWVTRFNEPLNRSVSLQTLPWSDWLNMQQTNNIKFIDYPATAVTLDTMSVNFNNPQNESFAEAVQFSAMTPEADNRSRRQVASEQLTLTNASGSTTYTNDYTTQTMEYTSGPTQDKLGLAYTATAENALITDMEFSVLGDIDAVDTGNMDETLEFHDIWDVLRINETNAANIGNNNLQITVDPDTRFFNQSIDVIYIPMSRMLWSTQGS